MLNSDDLKFQGVGNIGGGLLRQLYDRLHGRNKDTLHNCDGIAVTLEGALIRHQSPVYTLVLRLGDALVRTEINIAAYDPLLKELPVEHFGPSPAELKQQEVKRQWEAMTGEERAFSAVKMFRSQGLEARLGFDDRIPVKPANHPNVQVP